MKGLLKNSTYIMKTFKSKVPMVIFLTVAFICSLLYTFQVHSLPKEVWTNTPTWLQPYYFGRDLMDHFQPSQPVSVLPPGTHLWVHRLEKGRYEVSTSQDDIGLGLGWIYATHVNESPPKQAWTKTATELFVYALSKPWSFPDIMPRKIELLSVQLSSGTGLKIHSTAKDNDVFMQSKSLWYFVSSPEKRCSEPLFYITECRQDIERYGEHNIHGWVKIEDVTLEPLGSK